MEMFGLSKRELEQKFTRSEMALLAWRSQEMSYQMKQNSPPPRSGRNSDPEMPTDLPEHYYTTDEKTGEKQIDLRNVTGDEAYKFCSMQGMKLPIINSSRSRR